MYEFQQEDIERLEAILRKKHAPKRPLKPRKRADGEGTVVPITRRLKNGTEATYYWAKKTVVLGDSRKQFVAQARTELEAIEKRDRNILKAKVAYGMEPQSALPPDPKLKDLTVGDCLEDWLRERKRDDLAPATLHMYDARIRNHLLPAFGSESVRLLTYRQLKVFFEETLPAKGLGPDSIRQTFICLKSALDYYVRDGILVAHPMVGIKAPARKKKTLEDTRAIRRASKFLGEYLMVEALKAGQEARWFLGLLGLRQSEVLGMTDDSLDGARPAKRGRRVVVKQQLKRISAEHGCELSKATGKWSCGRSSTNCPQRIGENRWELTRTKTENGYREIIITEDAWQMLVAHRKKQQAKRRLPGFHPEPGEGLDKLFFTREDGKPIYAQRDRQALGELVGSIKNIPEDMTVHTLRHVATTALIEGGAERDDLIAMMGWSPKNADAQIATYSSADMAAKAADTTKGYVDSFFGGAAVKK